MSRPFHSYMLSTREDSGRSLLQLFGRIYSGLLVPSELLANPIECDRFCECVRREWGVRAKDGTILSALREAIQIAERPSLD